MFELGFEEGVELISVAIKKRDEEKLFMRWVSGGYEQLFSLDEYKKKFTGEENPNTGEEMPSDVQEIEAIMQKVKGIIGKIRGDI